MKPNILFLLIDSFRADKCHGNKKNSITPNLDLLIKNGAYFSHTICSAPVTCPSVSSIFTSLYPFETIVLDRNHFKLNPKVITYIKKLMEYGYHTYAITPELISYMGLNQVFENHIETYRSSSTLYDGLGDRIISKLESMSLKDPWIYYLHLLDLHGSAKFQLSEGPKEFQDNKYGINQYERMVSAMDVWIGKILQKINLEKTLIVLTADHGSEVGVYTPKMEIYRQKIVEYKPGLAYKSTHKITTNFPKFLFPIRKKLSKTYTNRKKEKIEQRRNTEIEKLEEQNLSNYEKRLLQHVIKPLLDVYDDRVKVPLIFAGYGIDSGKVISQQVRSIDIFPTIAEIVGMPKQNNLGRGRSLLSLMHGQKLEEIPIFLESASNSLKSSTSNVVGIRTSQYKYFRDRINSRNSVHLFDLKNDPLEENNIADLQPKVVKEMENILFNIEKGQTFEFKKQVISNNQEDKKIEKELKKLGYI